MDGTDGMNEETSKTLTGLKDRLDRIGVRL
jgi:hypothetical protein